jgi:1-acyl-sn-glycerol-3-phosphate acyltransferase
MVFTLTFAETIAIMLDVITRFMYNFLPGFFVFIFTMLPILIFYKIFRRGQEIIEKGNRY